MATQSDRMPALFIGHGNPMHAIEDTPIRKTWETLGKQLPRPRAVLCISAHWETRGLFVTAAERPSTIHDFGGFPKALFDVEYPAPGSPALAARILDLLDTSNAALPDPARGLDHGAWSFLVAMYPAADVPVVQLSLNTSRPARFHYDLAKALTPLRDEGVLIVGSGNIVHNLHLWSFHETRPADWALIFDERVRDQIAARDHESLIAWPRLSEYAPLAIPTVEHYLPLLYPLALQQELEPVRFFNTQVISSISMTSLVVGD